MWILILYMIAGRVETQVSVSSIEFKSQWGCEAALKSIIETLPNHYIKEVKGLCVENK